MQPEYCVKVHIVNLHFLNNFNNLFYIHKLYIFIYYRPILVKNCLNSLKMSDIASNEI